MEKMTDKEVLQKAIGIAVWNGVGYHPPIIMKPKNGMSPEYNLELPYWIMFSHDFAKAFWDNIHLNPIDIVMVRRQTEKLIGVDIEWWQHHLQQMVLCDNPIDYLRKYITPEK